MPSPPRRAGLDQRRRFGVSDLEREWAAQRAALASQHDEGAAVDIIVRKS